MYEVTIKKSFSAAHLLKEIGGKCEELHGHNFLVEVSVAAESLNEEGLLIDFRVVKRWTDEVLEAARPQISQRTRLFQKQESLFRSDRPFSLRADRRKGATGEGHPVEGDRMGVGELLA